MRRCTASTRARCASSTSRLDTSLLANPIREFECTELPELLSWPHHGAHMNRWITGARPRTLPAAVVPVAVGAAAAVGEPTDVVWWRVAAALLVSLMLQVGVNYANDYSDGVRGTDDVRVGPTRLVASGLASPSAVKRAALLSFARRRGRRVGDCAVDVAGAAARRRSGDRRGLVLHRRPQAVWLPRAGRGVRVRVLRPGRHGRHHVSPRSSRSPRCRW